MENNEKNQSGTSGENKHRRKPYYKHNRHRRPYGDRKNSRDNNNRDEQTNTPVDSENTATAEVAESTGPEVIPETTPADIPESTVSEYTAIAGGNKDEEAEILEEINSVTESEAETIENVSVTEEEELQQYEIIGVRFKSGGKIYYFAANSLVLAKGDPVIVDTARGIEFGICEIPNKFVTERDIVLPLRNAVRKATAEDISRHEICAAHEKEAAEIFIQKIAEHKLGMKYIDVEYAFDGSKLLFYFTAEGRVDFRELVKDLASVFRIRIELRQIGIRDETKLLGGIGLCGRPFCCKTFLPDFVQVSIKMAKEQNLSLNSQKISGACGRLMCCLRYEYETYQEEIKKTPRVDQIVSTPDGDGTVIEVQPLAGLIRVRFGAKTDMLPTKVYHRDDVKVIGGKGVKPQEHPTEQPQE